MKRNIIKLGGFIFFLVLMIYSYAEEKVPIKGLGFKVGSVTANQIWENDDSTDKAEDRVGLDFGFFLHFNIHDPYASGLFELHYIEKGCKQELYVYDFYGNYQFEILDNKITYISIPILLKLSIPNQYLSPYLIIGPRIDIKLSYDSEYLDDIYEEFFDINYGIDYGFGLETMIKDLTVSLEYRFSKDNKAAYIKSRDNEWWDNSYRIYNESSQLLIGVKYKY